MYVTMYIILGFRNGNRSRRVLNWQLATPVGGEAITLRTLDRFMETSLHIHLLTMDTSLANFYVYYLCVNLII